MPDAGTALPIPATPPIKPARTAVHGAAIALLAITDDGRAAVTQDAIGATRLWPTLDGTREPIIMPISLATQLAIAIDDTGFVIAALDDVGGMVVLHVATSGRVDSRVSIAPEPAIEAIAIAAQGVLAMRADQTLAILSATGEQIARLEGPAGARMKYLVTRNGRTLVLFARDSITYGRWVVGTAWGEITPNFSSQPQSRALLSPSGKLLSIDFESDSYLLDTTTGGILDYADGMPIGFADDTTIVQLEAGKLVWRSVSDRSGSEHQEATSVAAPMLVADGVVISANQVSLVMHTRDSVKQLGYAIGDVAGMHVLDKRIVLIGSGQQAMLLGEQLDERQSYALPDEDRTLTDVVPIDERFVIATHTYPSNGWWGLSVIDVAHKKTQQSMLHPLGHGDIRYEPSTQLLAVSDERGAYLTSWDATKQSFETWYTLEGGPADVHMVDARANDGIVAITVRAKAGGQLEIGEIAHNDLEVGAPIRPRYRYIVGGYARDYLGAGYGVAVDKLGTVYASGRGMFVGYKHGVEVMRITAGDSGQLAVHPSGAYITVYGDQRIRQYDATGALRWEIAAPLAQRIAWLGNDLVVDYAGGLGKIDAATGALIQRTCGWSFGLRALSNNDLLAGDSICDAP
jgi:hypothetical protein